MQAITPQVTRPNARNQGGTGLSRNRAVATLCAVGALVAASAFVGAQEPPRHNVLRGDFADVDPLAMASLADRVGDAGIASLLGALGEPLHDEQTGADKRYVAVLMAPYVQNVPAFLPRVSELALSRDPDISVAAGSALRRLASRLHAQKFESGELRHQNTDRNPSPEIDDDCRDDISSALRMTAALQLVAAP